MLNIIHETKDYIVVNKSAGLITEKNPYEDSLESQVFMYLQKSKKNVFVGVVHRLDRVTSGVVLFAKKKSTLKYFNAQFEKKAIQKTYLAVCSGIPKKMKGKLSHFLEKDLKNKKAIIYNTKTTNSKSCVLLYSNLKSFDNKCLIDIKPQTGRFHQIRAQLSFIDLPIIGDEKYGSNIDHFKNEVCLHASKIKFKDFDSDEIIELSAEKPSKGVWNLFD